MQKLLDFFVFFLQLEDLCFPQARDVVFCDRMMTEAAIKLPKRSSSSSVDGTHDDSLSPDSCFANSIDSLPISDIASNSDGSPGNCIKQEVDDEGGFIKCETNVVHHYSYPDASMPSLSSNDIADEARRGESVQFLSRMPSRYSLKRQRQESTDGMALIVIVNNVILIKSFNF